MPKKNSQIETQIFIDEKIDLATITPGYFKDHDSKPETQRIWADFAFERLRDEYERFRLSVQTVVYASIALNAVAAMEVSAMLSEGGGLMNMIRAWGYEGLIAFAGISFLVGILCGFIFALMMAGLLRKCYNQYNVRIIAYLKSLITDREFMYHESTLERWGTGTFSALSFLFFLIGLALVMWALVSSYMA